MSLAEVGALLSGLAALSSVIRDVVRDCRGRRVGLLETDRTAKKSLLLTIGMPLLVIALGFMIVLLKLKGLAIAAGALIAGLAMAALIVRAFLVERHSASEAAYRSQPKGSGMKTALRVVAFVAAMIGAGYSLGAGAIIQLSPPLPLNAELVKNAWDAYNAADFPKAIAKAKQCIGEFEGAALLEQQKLIDQRAPQPPDVPPSEADKKTVMSRGLLNDVGTAFYIAGRASESLGFTEDAKMYYQKALRFTYARAWDPKGWLWSPSAGAQGRLQTLK